jgi:hypothetical protein
VKYDVNQGKRDYAIRMGCEAGVYQFVHDYAEAMGMSASAATRRLVMIGARCESEHGHQTMPASYDGLRTGPRKINDDPFKDFD